MRKAGNPGRPGNRSPGINSLVVYSLVWGTLNYWPGYCEMEGTDGLLACLGHMESLAWLLWDGRHWWSTGLSGTHWITGLATVRWKALMVYWLVWSTLNYWPGYCEMEGTVGLLSCLGHIESLAWLLWDVCDVCELSMTNGGRVEPCPKRVPDDCICNMGQSWSASDRLCNQGMVQETASLRCSWWRTFQKCTADTSALIIRNAAKYCAVFSILFRLYIRKLFANNIYCVCKSFW